MESISPGGKTGTHFPGEFNLHQGAQNRVLWVAIANSDELTVQVKLLWDNLIAIAFGGLFTFLQYLYPTLGRQLTQIKKPI